jgi:cholesterol transport system auxiliary component
MHDTRPRRPAVSAQPHEATAAAVFAGWDARLVLAGMILSVLAACAGPPRTIYDIAAATSGFPVRAPRGQLAVLEPVAIEPVLSDRIVVRTSPETLANLGGAQWVDRLPVLVQTRLVESFENAHVLRAVGRSGILADHNLHTEIRRFELDSGRGEAVVEIFARLSGSGGQAVGGRLFSAHIPVQSDDPAYVASALNAALKEVMRQIVTWTTQKV